MESLADALQREHHDIDDGLDALSGGTDLTGPGRQAATRAIHALRRHIYLEEQFLFPPLYDAGLVAPVLVMLREHAQIWNTLDALQRDLDSDADTATLRASAHQLTVQLLHHNSKEERILYPRADTALTRAATEHLRAFLDTGQLPHGWTPTRLRTGTDR